MSVHGLGCQRYGKFGSQWRIRGALVCLALALANARGAAATTVTAEQAMVRAVTHLLGADVQVTLTQVQTEVAGDTALEAVVDPAGRVGQPVRFVLMSGGRRRGIAVAVVGVRARHVRATRAIAKGEIVGADAVESVEGDLSGVALRRLPTLAHVVGRPARRAVHPGEPITDAVVDLPPLVKSGDRVSLVVTVGRVRASGPGIASGSGHIGDEIQVLQPGRSRPVRGRITEPGTVEMIP